MPDKVKSPEACVWWTCEGMKSPFVCDHRRAPGEVGRCGPRKIPCELEAGRDCGMYMTHPCVSDKEKERGKTNERNP